VIPALLWLLGCQPECEDCFPVPDESSMVDIATTLFAMGHPEATPGPYGAEWRENELPPHEVTVSAYAIDADEVTVAQWVRFVDTEAGNVHFHPLQPLEWDGEHFHPRSGEADRPIRYVSWYDAASYCGWAGKRLPTEAEWELAAKGAEDDRRYPWGEESAGCDRAVYYTNAAYCEDIPAPVGSRSPAGDSPFGLRDTAGNVAEWVFDAYGRYSLGAQIDPTGPAGGTLRVLRGGGLRDTAESIRTTLRFGADPADRSEGVGFRCVVPR